MKTLNQENFENFKDFLLSDEEMILVRGGDDDGDRGMTVPPITEPEI
ncbi:MAG: hypothetical protein ACQERS_02460 [Bacteroidota bacterium]